MTSFLPQIPELRLVGVFDAGVPRRERIVLKVEQKLDIGWYAIVLAIRAQPAGMAQPLRDSVCWIGSGTVEPNDWFFIYTGAGSQMTIPADSDHGKLFFEFWGRKETVFHDSQIVPMLWRLNGVTIERADPQLPAIGAENLTTYSG
jgi:hypothetical protein